MQRGCRVQWRGGAWYSRGPKVPSNSQRWPCQNQQGVNATAYGDGCEGGGAGCNRGRCGTVGEGYSGDAGGCGEACNVQGSVGLWVKGTVGTGEAVGRPVMCRGSVGLWVRCTRISRKAMWSRAYLHSNLMDPWIRLISSKNSNNDCSPAVQIKNTSSLKRV